jgi:hypothetical protein
MAIRVGVLPPGVRAPDRQARPRDDASKTRQGAFLRSRGLRPGIALRTHAVRLAVRRSSGQCLLPGLLLGAFSADRKGVGRGPRYQAGQTLRRRFAQKPGEDEGSCVFALTISWSSASRLRRSRYPFSATSSTSSTVASLMPIPSTVQPFRRTCLSAIPLTRRPVRRWSLGTSQSIITTEAPLPGPLDISPSFAGVGVSTHPV